MKEAEYYQGSSGKRSIRIDTGNPLFGSDPWEPPNLREERECEFIPYTVGSDYSGDIVTRSNYETLKKDLRKYKGVYDVFGGYSTYGIAYIPAELSRKGREKIAEIVEALESYPSIDDEAVSELEYHLILEAFNDERRYELPQGDEETDAEYEARINRARAIIIEGMGDIAYPETGCAVYIKWETVKERLAAQ